MFPGKNRTTRPNPDVLLVDTQKRKTQESFRDKWFDETTLRGASAELPRHGCHFMNAFVLIALFHQNG